MNKKHDEKRITYFSVGRRLAAAVLSVVLLGSLGGCAQKKPEETYTDNRQERPVWQGNLNVISPAAYAQVTGLTLEPGTYISVIGKQSNTDFWKTVEAGAMQAAKDLNEALGYTGSDKIQVVYNAPDGEEDVNQQVNILDEELSREPDAIAMSCIDESAHTVQFDLVTNNGIPIVAFDSGNQYPGIQCTIKTDNNDAARTGAYKLADEMGGTGDILLLVHDSTSESAKQREESFKAELEAEYQEVQIVETIYCDDLEEIKKQIAEKDNEKISENETEIYAEDITDEEVIRYYLQKHPQVTGMFGTNIKAVQLGLSALEAEDRLMTSDRRKGQTEAGKDNSEQANIQEKPGKDNPEKNDLQEDSKKNENFEAEEEPCQVVVAGFDGGKEQIKALEEGKIAGLVVQNPFGMGYASVIASARCILQKGNEAEVNTAYTWVTRENLDNPKIRNMLY